ncbi:3-isopropylmalate dehydratase small subunit [Candidatus Micrarchaeota archaeon]|nr:3-isopropylmalate dehydratase small subunit [Candidatus Micrarchaeota archaeon]
MSSKIQRMAGTAIVVRGDDIDTDRIIPARFLKAVTFDELGGKVFYDERFDANGQTKNHPLNAPHAKQAKIGLVNKNFGCGSSREHAPQAIKRFGIQALVGESFAEIFASNCLAIGVPAVTASHDDVKKAMDFVEKNSGQPLELDVERGTLSVGGQFVSIALPAAAKKALVDGRWDFLQELLDAGERIEQTASKLPYLSFNAWSQKS